MNVNKTQVKFENQHNLATVLEVMLFFDFFTFTIGLLWDLRMFKYPDGLGAGGLAGGPFDLCAARL